ncbi:MAG: universal stress protein [Acidimicrobiia bacterium]
MSGSIQTSPPAIIVGVGAGRSADAALRWAVAQAAGRHPVRAVHVVRSSATAIAGFDAVVHLPEPDVFDAAVALERSIERAVPDPALRATIETRVLVGAPVPRLLECCEGAGMLVLGRGRSSGRRLFGVARQLISLAPCAVVVVPPGADTAPSAAGPVVGARRAELAYAG